MKKCVGVVCLALVCAACGVQKPATPSSRFLAWSEQDLSPKRVCVLPFTNETGQADVGGQVRRSFAGHLSLKRFTDVELYEIDTNLPPDWKQLPAQTLGETLGCHALVYGIVTQANRLYLGLYADIALDGGILLIDTKTGQSLAEESYATRFRHGDVPLSVLGIVPSAVMMLRNITNEQMLRAIDDLGRNLAALVPDLPHPAPTSSLARPETAVAPPPASPPAPDVVRHAPSGPASYGLQVAAFRSPEQAAYAVQLLQEKGYQAEIVASPEQGSRWHRVVLGPFSSAARAKQVGAAIRRDLPFSPIVKVSVVP